MHKEHIELRLGNKDALLELRGLFRDIGGHELFLVGGCVRDLLLGREPKDYDLCTDATPDEVKHIVDSANAKEDGRYSIIPTGIKHGTVTILDRKSNESYECTTYRVDGDYSDCRHPDDISFTGSLEEDLRRRDFTVNSFAYDFENNDVVMLDESFMSDLRMGVIRCVGDPAERFNEDALRMLRAIRFAAQMGFSIDKCTYEAIKAKANAIRHVSKERIRDELTKIVMSDAPQMLELFCVSGLEAAAFSINGSWTPFSDMLGCGKHNRYHYADTFHHTMDVIKAVPKDFSLRWAALFHDIGKPSSLSVDDEGWEHFIGHADRSVTIAEALMSLLKFPNAEIERILKFVKWHDYQLAEASNKKFKQRIVDIGVEDFLAFLKLREADALSHALSAETSRAIDCVSICKDRFVRYLKEKPPVTLKDLALKGTDVIAEGGIKGPMVGQCLNWMLDKVLENPADNTREKLLEYLQEFKDTFLRENYLQ